MIDTNDNSTGAALNWFPTNEARELPSDVTPLWARLEELTKLTWPTAAEQVERQLLVTWLKPGGNNVVTDAQAFEAACDLMDYPGRATKKLLEPVFAIAADAWMIISALAAGETLHPARFNALDYFDERDSLAVEEGRHKQALDWWDATMRVFDGLVRDSDINTSDLMWRMSSHDMQRAMRKYLVAPLFDSPMAVGAGIYLEPGPLPGMGFGGPRQDQAVHIMGAMTNAVVASMGLLEKVDVGDSDAHVAALLSHDFSWQLLKGYTWAGANKGSEGHLAYLSARHESIWSNTKAALIRGREVLNAHRAQLDGVVGFSSRGSLRSESIGKEPTADLIARMDAHVEQAKRDNVPLENRL